MNEVTVRHALLATNQELADVASGQMLLFRDRPTSLRGLIAIADVANGRVEALGFLEMVEPAAGDVAPGEYLWSVLAVEPLSFPFQLGAPSVGPIWARLTIDDRRLVKGLDPDHSEGSTVGSNGGAEAEDVAIPEPAPDVPESLTTGREERGLEDEAELAATEESTEVDPTAGTDALDEPLDEAPGELDTALLLPEDDSFTAPAEAAVSLPEVVGVEDSGLPENTSALPSPEEEIEELGYKDRVEAADQMDFGAARQRAMLFVPSGPVSEEQARQMLIDLRETEIKPTFPEVKATAGLLRRTLLDRLINEAVESVEDFERLIPRDVRFATDRHQIEAYLEPVVQILSKIK